MLTDIFEEVADISREHYSCFLIIWAEFKLECKYDQNILTLGNFHGFEGCFRGYSALGNHNHTKNVESHARYWRKISLVKMLLQGETVELL